ncbi:MAG: nucleotide exchange factor GrpE [Ruminococcaceae bacterium]|nr:nucleotide exchange factor GrpE [Oscillospiraceae bacterium]
MAANKEINMTEETEKETDTTETVETEEATEETAEIDSPEVAKLKEDYAGMYDKYVRLVAEFDNYKKRTVKEKADIYSAAKTDVIEKLLPVIDNLERAELYNEPEKVLEGLKMIIKQFNEYLEKLDIKEIPALDCEFNPELHNAVMHEDNEDAPQNTVIEVFQKGYTIGDKVLRHAMVKVVN